MPATDLRPLFIAAGLPEPVPEYRFAPPRRWRFDWAWLNEREWEGGVALEIEGGAWTQGRHFRGPGILSDMAKYNRAAIMGWAVLRCTPKQVASGEAFAVVADALRVRGWEG